MKLYYALTPHSRKARAAARGRPGGAGEIQRRRRLPRGAAIR